MIFTTVDRFYVMHTRTVNGFACVSFITVLYAGDHSPLFISSKLKKKNGFILFTITNAKFNMTEPVIFH